MYLLDRFFCSPGCCLTFGRPVCPLGPMAGLLENASWFSCIVSQMPTLTQVPCCSSTFRKESFRFNLIKTKTLHLTAAGVPTQNISCIFGHKINLRHACLWALLLIIPISSFSFFCCRKYDGTGPGKPLNTAMFLQPLQ